MVLLSDGATVTVTGFSVWALPVHLPLSVEILLHDFLLFAYVVGGHVRLGEVLVASFVESSDSHLVNLIQDLSAILNSDLLEKLLNVMMLSRS